MITPPKAYDPIEETKAVALVPAPAPAPTLAATANPPARPRRNI